MADFKDFIINLYNLYFYSENDSMLLIIISIISALYIINLIVFFIAQKYKVNIKYIKDNFIITKNGKHSFLVKDGMIIAYKPNKLFSKFKYYINNKSIKGE